MSFDRNVEALQDEMIETQIIARGICDPRVIAALRAVPRDRFVPDDLRESAFDDRALPIEQGQTISQPFIHAYMTELLDVQPAHRVLEIGTGSGYQTALLARLGAEVYTVERSAELSRMAQKRLERLETPHIHYLVGDGTLGWSEQAPFDRIIVTAAGPTIPEALKAQLGPNGVLVMPVGDIDQQRIVRLQRLNGRTVERLLISCRFVQLTGAQGW